MVAKPTLLVVDDEPDLVQSVKDLLRFDYKVYGATRAAEGLAILEKEPIQVVMTDQRMPEMTGVEFLRRIKDSFPDAIRLLFTAYADIAAISDAINEGNVYRYLSKPLQPDELRAVLKQAVDQWTLVADRKRLMLEVQDKNRLLEDANRDLRRANELKKAFIKVASHELRTPLTIALGMAELSHRLGHAVPPLAEWIDQLYQANRRLSDRVDQIVSMLQAGQFDRPLQPADLDLAGLVRSAAQAVHSFVEQRRQQLIVETGDDLGMVRGERDKLHDCLVQLLINAIKFTPDGGTIRIAARRLPDGAASLTVSDTGVGIDEASQPYVFDPFFTRLDVSRHSSGTFEFDRRGLGLGLAVVKAFIEMHGGKVDVNSDVGKGTTFTIVLPAPQQAC